MGDDSHYPSPREALFGNGHVANIRCAVKYIAWQLFHGMMAVCVVPFLLIFLLFEKLVPNRAVGYIAGATGTLFGWLDNWVTRTIVRSVTHALFYIFMAFALVIFGPMFAVMIGCEKVEEHTGVWSRITSIYRSGGEKAASTPGVRRVYGNCPVSWDITPRWFETIEEYFEP